MIKQKLETQQRIKRYKDNIETCNEILAEDNAEYLAFYTRCIAKLDKLLPDHDISDLIAMLKDFKKEALEIEEWKKTKNK